MRDDREAIVGLALAHRVAISLAYRSALSTDRPIMPMVAVAARSRTLIARTAVDNRVPAKFYQLRDDGHILSCAYRVRIVGRYDQLASFCDGIYAAHGLAAVDALEIEDEEAADACPLQASLQVTWYGPGLTATIEDKEAALQ